jgi:hypothetical protein
MLAPCTYERCTMRKTPIDDATARQLAVRASVDPRTILKAAAGQPVRGLAGHRARAALRAAGFLPPPLIAVREGGQR